MLLRILLTVILLLAALPTAAQDGRGRGPGALDSTDRREYVYAGPPVPFGLNAASVTLSVPDYYVINDVDVLLTVRHTWDGDVIVRLRSPTGTIITLIRNVGDSGDDFVNTYLNDAAALPLSEGTAPFTGSFRPVGHLSGFNGLHGRGTWTLQLDDAYPQNDHGRLEAWTLLLGGLVSGAFQGTVLNAAGSPVAGVEVRAMPGNYLTTTDGDGFYRLMVLEGTYRVEAGKPTWCTFQSADSFTVGQFDTVRLDLTLHQPLLHVPRSSLNLLREPEAASADSLPVENRGTCDLELSAVCSAPWLIPPVESFVVPGGSAAGFPFTIDTHGLPEGDYFARLTLTHNGPDSPRELPVFLTVLRGVAVERGADGLPVQFELRGGFPNPFNSRTRIVFALPQAAEVRLDLYDVQGRQVQRILGEWRAPGVHAVSLDGATLPSGIYLVRMNAGNWQATAKLILFK